LFCMMACFERRNACLTERVSACLFIAATWPARQSAARIRLYFQCLQLWYSSVLCCHCSVDWGIPLV
jgi:hypothetical protein